MATKEDSMAQDFMPCDLCKTSPVQMHCNLCAVNLCEACVGKHVSKDHTKEHNIVIFRMRNVKPVFPICNIHKGQTCEMQCKQCAVPVCLECIASESQQSHTLLLLMKLCQGHRDIIEKKTDKLQKKIYPKYEAAISETENHIAKLPENHEQLLTSIDDHGASWHQEVDKIVKRLKAEAQEMKMENLETLKKQLSELKNLLSEIHQVILDNRKLLQANIVNNIINHEDKTAKYASLPERTCTDLTFLPLLFQGQQLTKMFGSLIPTSLSQKKFEKSKIIQDKKVIDCVDTGTEYEGLTTVECVNEDNIWVHGHGRNENQIKLFNTEGSLLRKFTTVSGKCPHGITGTSQGELVYTDSTDRCIYIIRNGNHEKIITEKDWEPTKVCFTSSGDLLVGMRKDYDTPKKVVRYRRSTVKRVIQLDEKGRPLFSKGTTFLFINENKNGDLCVSDCGTNQVLGIIRAGNLRFKYPGNLSSQKYRSFNPRGIVSDSDGHILIADEISHYIHIIDQDGNFICYIDNCQLSKPVDLSLNKNNILFVAEWGNTKVKMIKYLE